MIKACASGVKTTWGTVPGAAPYNVCRSAAGGAYAGIGTGRTPGCVDRRDVPLLCDGTVLKVQVQPRPRGERGGEVSRGPAEKTERRGRGPA